MNIIELYENAGIYRENLTEFTFEDTVKIQKQFEIERTHNPNLNPSLQQDLTRAITEFPKELLFISSNRILYNFFAKTNHSRNRFSSDQRVSVNDAAVKSFISTFLSADLDTFFEEKIAQNRFDDVEDFLAVKEYLPESALNKLRQNIDDKFDATLNTITNNPSQESTLSFNFIKHRSFYDLLSHFRSPKNDERIRTLLDTMTSTLVDFNIKSAFLNPMMIAMGNYKAVDNDLASTLKFNKDQTLANTQKVGSSSSSALSTGGTIVLIILVLRIILLMVRCNS